jgi:hypothetical protein
MGRAQNFSTPILTASATLARSIKENCMATSLIRELATHRGPQSEQPVIRYDAIRMLTMVLDGDVWIPSYESAVLSKTKKADLETGEDQKSS